MSESAVFVAGGEQGPSSSAELKNCGYDPAALRTIGQCKWFNGSKGFGFLTVITGPFKDSDVFLHHSGITTKSSHYRTLTQGEYVSCTIVQGDKGAQAVEVTGVCGGPLLCDTLPNNNNRRLPLQ
jgi:CspA family cold shock protein